MEGKIKIGPVGNHDLNTTTMVNWDEGSQNGIISQVFLSHSFAGIFAIQFQFMLDDDKFILSDHHGRNIGSKFDAIAFNYPHEYITGISGEYCKTSLDLASPPHIRRLKFTTNTNEYDPFGCFKGPYATSPTEETFEFKLGRFCQFGGFYGTYDVSGLQYIGAYLLPTIAKPKSKPKTSTSNAEEKESTIVLG